jgi:hypothetical protein
MDAELEIKSVLLEIMPKVLINLITSYDFVISGYNRFRELSYFLYNPNNNIFTKEEKEFVLSKDKKSKRKGVVNSSVFGIVDGHEVIVDINIIDRLRRRHRLRRRQCKKNKEGKSSKSKSKTPFKNNLLLATCPTYALSQGLIKSNKVFPIGYSPIFHYEMSLNERDYIKEVFRYINNTDVSLHDKYKLDKVFEDPHIKVTLSIDE